jgi:hypothetical protein
MRTSRRHAGPVLRSPGFMTVTDGPVAPPVGAGDGFSVRLRDVLASWARVVRSREIRVHLGVQDVKNRDYREATRSIPVAAPAPAAEALSVP